jgi:small subunit ribosomal protein S15
MLCSASYKNKENINLSRVPGYARHDKDTGSSEIQVARLSARIEQISGHLKSNRKDFAAKRGLVALLSQRKTLLQYLYREDR